MASTTPILALLNELLPIVFGTGKNAIWDWSFIYVTMRWILIPILGISIGIFQIVYFSKISNNRIHYLLGSLISFATPALLWLYNLPLK